MELLFLITTPILAAAASFGVRRRTRIAVLEAIALIAAGIETILAAWIGFMVVQNGIFSLSPFLSIDAFSLLLVFLITVGSIAVSCYSIGYLRAEVRKEIIGFRRVRQYFVFLHLFLAAMFLAVLSASPVIMWIAIEATTLSTAFLISFYNKPSAMEAAWKYLILNSIGLLLAFFGTLLFFTPVLGGGHAGTINWDAISQFAPFMNPLVAKMAFIFVLVGYGTKVGLVPMHTWLPDAHSKAPSPISALLSGMLLNCAMYAILRFKVITDSAVGPLFSQHLLIWLGTLSLVLASFMIFRQKDYKRLLAYSSIEHVGIIALGFGFGGFAAIAAILHMIYHSLVKSVLFLSSGNIMIKYSSSKIVNVSSMRLLLPVTSGIFFMGLLGAAGVPPFGIFFTEIFILFAGIHVHPVVSVIALSALALSFVGLLRHASAMLYGRNLDELPEGEANNWTVFPLVILMMLVLILSVFLPQWLESLLGAAAFPYTL